MKKFGFIAMVGVFSLLMSGCLSLFFPVEKEIPETERADIADVQKLLIGTWENKSGYRWVFDENGKGVQILSNGVPIDARYHIAGTGDVKYLSVNILNALTGATIGTYEIQIDKTGTQMSTETGGRIARYKKTNDNHDLEEIKIAAGKIKLEEFNKLQDNPAKSALLVGMWRQTAYTGVYIHCFDKDGNYTVFTKARSNNFVTIKTNSFYKVTRIKGYEVDWISSINKDLSHFGVQNSTYWLIDDNTNMLFGNNYGKAQPRFKKISSAVDTDNIEPLLDLKPGEDETCVVTFRETFKRFTEFNIHIKGYDSRVIKITSFDGEPAESINWSPGISYTIPTGKHAIGYEFTIIDSINGNKISDKKVVEWNFSKGQTYSFICDIDIVGISSMNAGGGFRYTPKFEIIE